MKLLIIDTDRMFLSDLEAHSLLHYTDMDIVTLKDINQLDDVIKEERPDKIIISAPILDSFEDWSQFGVNLFSYSKAHDKAAEDIKKAHDKGLKSYGYVASAKKLLEAIDEDMVMTVEEAEKAESEKPAEDVKSDKAKHTAPDFDDLYDEDDIFDNEPPRGRRDTTSRSRQDKSREEREKDSDSRSEETRQETTSRRGDSDRRRSSEKDAGRDGAKDPEDRRSNNDRRDSAEVETRRSDRRSEDGRRNRRETSFDDGNTRRSRRESSERRSDDNTRRRRREEPEREEEFDRESERSERSARSNEVTTRLREAREERARQARERDSLRRKDIERKVDRDLGLTKDPAKVITVFSAKGGVGKTTISAELATYLALTSHGRGKLRVCIVDFNIDFGDVLSTLKMDDHKICMSQWAADIKERITRGGEPGSLYERGNINYSRKDIEYFLQKDERSGLYALLAPVTNEDSMDIGADEIIVMLDNLIYNGGFDFVVCDTGNNLRDSTFTALQKADDVLLVVNQDVNTVNCNLECLATLQKMGIGFNMDKVKLIVNKIKSSKVVGVSADEVMEYMTNPDTGRPFECVALITDNPAVENANNTGIPLIFKPDDRFTKSIGAIVDMEIGNTFVLPEIKKQGLFARLFHRG